jgi:hypothetical protein
MQPYKCPFYFEVYFRIPNGAVAGMKVVCIDLFNSENSIDIGARKVFNRSKGEKHGKRKTKSQGSRR